MSKNEKTERGCLSRSGREASLVPELQLTVLQSNALRLKQPRCQAALVGRALSLVSVCRPG